MTETWNDQTFAAIDMSGERPPRICHRCAAHAMEHLPTGVVLAYCRHFEAGVFRRPGGDWHVREPITFEEFRAGVLIGVLEGEARYSDAQTEGMTKQ